MEDNSEIVSSENESISGSMEDILQLSNKSYSARDRLKMCCRPTYRVRKLKNKGALLILVWSLLVTSVFYFASMYPHNIFHQNSHIYSIIWGLTLSIAGWLADVYLGRYRVIRWSILIMWIASVLVVASSILSQFVDSYSSVNNNYVTIVVNMIMFIAFGAYQANIVLFGTDQLQDASTDEITSFISWYVYTYLIGGVIATYIDLCLISAEAYNGLLVKFIICVCLTVMVVLLFLFKNIFLREPITQNPFQLIYKVIKYAIKTKHPRCRSAFTYCEDELPSRIDFGKSKYGGPFTTEEVENVKTFLRLLVIILTGSMVASTIYPLNSIGYQHNDRDNDKLDTLLHKCSWKITVTPQIAYYSGAVLLPLHEFVFYPLLQKHLPCIQSYQWKLSVGVVSQIARVIALMAIDLVTRHSYLEHNNVTLECIFQEKSSFLRSSFDVKWMILPHLLNSLSAITSAIGAFEFICSQTPYSMRGLLLGALYGIAVLYSLMGFGILQPFTKPSRAWGVGIISCEFWYMLLMLLILILDTVMLRLVLKWYKNRKREDILPNEHIFAERYYSK